MKVIVISLDALMYSDLEYIKQYPNIGRLLSLPNKMCKEVEGIYPTYTYPSHATIMTGTYPDKHGIYHNEIEGTPFWFWYASYIKSRTMASYAKEKGLVTASVCWPCMASSPDVDYLIADIWSIDESESLDPYFAKADSPSAAIYYERYKHRLNSNHTPWLDNFAAGCLSDIIRDHRPDLSFIHISYLDQEKHNNGVNPERLGYAFKHLDDKVGELIAATEEAGIFDETVFVLLGDHGQRDVKRVFYLNEALKRMGYENRIKSVSSSFSTQIYLDGIDEKEGRVVLERVRAEYPGYISRILSTSECRNKYHLDGPFSFVLEGEEGTVFGDKVDGAIEEAPRRGDYHISLASHGYTPEDGPHPPFIMAGLPIGESRAIDKARLVDEAPTIMKLFGIEMKDVDGSAMEF